MSAQIQQASILSGRQLVLAVTVALHAAAISGLMAWRIAEVMTGTTSDVPIPLADVKPDPPLNPLPANSDPKIARTIAVPQLPDPVIRPIDDVADETRIVIATDETKSGTGSAVQEHPVPPDTPLRYRATRPSDDYYPPQAIRMEQEGVTIVRTCVDATGALSSAPQVVKSSRSRLLDAAAVTWAREALQFTPATSAGAAMAACKEFRVNFTLH